MKNAFLVRLNYVNHIHLTHYTSVFQPFCCSGTFRVSNHAIKPVEQDHEFQCSDSVMSVFMTDMGLYSTSWFKCISLKH